MRNYFSPIHLFPQMSIEHIRWKDILVSILVALVLTTAAFHWIPLEEVNPVEPYELYAQNPFSFREFPYGARMATPVLVSFLPCDIHTGFRVVAFASFVLSEVFLVLLLRLVGVSLGYSLSLLPAFLFASTAKFIIANAWYIDPMSYVLLVLVFLGMLTGHLGLTMASLALGALNRPESLLVIPVLVIAWWDRKKPLLSLIPVGFCILPAILLALSMRLIWPLVSDFQIWREMAGGVAKSNPQPYGLIFQQQGFRAFLDPRIYQETLPYLWGLAGIGMLQVSRRVFLISLSHIILALSPMVIATDYFRLPFYVFPSLMILAGIGMMSLSKIHRYVSWFVIATVWLCVFFAPQSILVGCIAGVIYGLIYFARNPKPHASRNP